MAPPDLAEDYDNVGLLVGHPDASVGAVLVALDATGALVDEALFLGASLIVTHHPITRGLAEARTRKADGPAGPESHDRGQPRPKTN